MLFLTNPRVTRRPRPSSGTISYIEGITEMFLDAGECCRQATPAARRGTHAKGVSVRAEFEVFDVPIGRDAGWPHGSQRASSQRLVLSRCRAVCEFGLEENSDFKATFDR